MSDSVNFRNDLLSKQMFLSIGFMIRLRGGAPVINRLESPWKLVRYLTNLTIVKLDLFAPTWLWKISSKFYSTSCFHIFFLVESPKLSLQATFFLVESPFSYGIYRQRKAAARNSSRRQGMRIPGMGMAWSSSKTKRALGTLAGQTHGFFGLFGGGKFFWSMGKWDKSMKIPWKMVIFP